MFWTEEASEAVVQHTPGADLPPGPSGSPRQENQEFTTTPGYSKLAGAGLAHGATLT